MQNSSPPSFPPPSSSRPERDRLSPPDDDAPPAADAEGTGGPHSDGSIGRIRSRLRRIFADETRTTMDQIRAALRLGAERFGVEGGHLVRLDPATGDHKVVSKVGPHSGIESGATTDLSLTYCRAILAGTDPLVLERAAEQGWAHDPAYERYGFSCYLGTKVVVDGALYGTVCFADRGPAPRPFGTADRALLELIAESVERALERDRRAEEADRLRNRYRLLLEGAPDAIVLADADTGRILEVNEAMTDLIGAPRSAIVGRRQWALHPAGEEARYQRFLDRCHRSGRHETIREFDDGTQVCVCTDAGTRIPVEVSATTVEHDGQPLALGIFRDVRDRLETEQEARLRADAMAMTTDGMAVLAPDGTYRYVNQAHAEVYGYDDPDALVGASWTMCYDEAELVRFETEILPRLYDNGEWRGEAIGQRANGDHFPQELTLTTFGDGGIICVVRDISDRTRRTEALRQREAALQQAGEAVLITEAEPLDEPGPRITYANAAFEELTGYDEEEVLGRTPRLLQGPETDQSVVRGLRRALERGEMWEGETVNYRKDGTPYRVQWTVAPVRDENGEMRYCVSVQRDVTAEREREAALREARREAERASRLKSAMLANMSHELRTPLTSIIGFAEAIGDEVGAETGAPVARFAELIEGSGHRLMETLNSLLTLSKLEAGEVEVSAEPVDLFGQARRLVGQMQPQAEAADVELNVIGDQSTRARADEGGVEIVLSNLLSNAIKYNQAGGTVWVRAFEDEGQACLEVEDTGIGMDPEDIDGLFEAFEQASEGLSREYEGTGLGLSIVRRLVDLMNATIDVESREGEGSRFLVRWPPAEVSIGERPPETQSER